MPIEIPSGPPPESVEELCAMRSRFFAEALTSFQASSSKFRVISTASPIIGIMRPGNRIREDHCPLPPTPAPKPPRKLVILDSSFNPPTYAHLNMAISAVFDFVNNNPLQSESCVRLLFILSINNADKAPKPAAFDQRLSMMWSFARDVQKWLSIGQRGGEIGVHGVSVDIGLSTLPYFHGKSQVVAEDEFYRGTERAAGEDQESAAKQEILVGYDTLIRLFDPKYYPSEDGNGMKRALGPLFDRAELRVTMRPDDEWGGITEQKQYIESLFKPRKLEEVGLDKSWETKIKLVQQPQTWKENAVSSTKAREAAKEGNEEVVKKMIPPKVWEWIQSERLYLE